MTTTLLTYLVFLLLSDRFGVVIAALALTAGFLSLFLVPIVGWWIDCAKLWWQHISIESFTANK